MYEFNISVKENDILLIGQMYKRIGKYEKALEVYNMIESIMGNSGIIDVAKAKVLISMGKYKDAIVLLEIAQESFFYQYNSKDESITEHLNTLKNRDKVSKDQFMKYVDLVSGKNFIE